MPLVETSVGPLEDGVEYAFIMLVERRDTARTRNTEIRVCGTFKDLSDANGAAKQMCMDWPEWKEIMDERKYCNYGITNRDADETLFLGMRGIQEWRRVDGGLRIYLNAGRGEKLQVSVVPQVLQPSRKQRSEWRKRQEVQNHETSQEMVPSLQLPGQVESKTPRKRARYFGDSEWYQDERELLKGDLAPGIIYH